MQPIEIICDLCCNHCGDVDIALQMVDVAKRCGVNSVKIQLRDMANAPPSWADMVYTGPHSYGKTYLEHRQSLELTGKEYMRVVAHAHSLGLQCGASLWDTASFELAFVIGVDFLKVPSAHLTNDALLRLLEWAALHRHMPIHISTGMSTEAEVIHAIDDFGWPEELLTLYVCTSSYPCATRDINLRRLDTFISRWGHRARIGISGHWPGIQIDAAAVALGAEAIERHFTLNRTWRGTDHAASLEPRGLELLVRDVRAVEDAMGSGEIRVLDCEVSARKKLRGV